MTIEDILEEIVGDIQDEYDPEEESYVQAIGPGAYLLNSRFDIYSISKLLNIELPDEDADTLGGMIYSLLGHVPEQGESVQVAGWRFTVLSLDGRRIDQVRADFIVDHGSGGGSEPQPAQDKHEQAVGASVLKFSSTDG